jgi:hypothetical protein
LMLRLKIFHRIFSIAPSSMFNSPTFCHHCCYAQRSSLCMGGLQFQK